MRRLLEDISTSAELILNQIKTPFESLWGDASWRKKFVGVFGNLEKHCVQAKVVDVKKDVLSDQFFNATMALLDAWTTLTNYVASVRAKREDVRDRLNAIGTISRLRGGRGREGANNDMVYRFVDAHGNGAYNVDGVMLFLDNFGPRLQDMKNSLDIISGEDLKSGTASVMKKNTGNVDEEASALGTERMAAIGEVDASPTGFGDAVAAIRNETAELEGAITATDEEWKAEVLAAISRCKNEPAFLLSAGQATLSEAYPQAFAHLNDIESRFIGLQQQYGWAAWDDAARLVWENLLFGSDRAPSPPWDISYPAEAADGIALADADGPLTVEPGGYEEKNLKQDKFLKKIKKIAMKEFETSIPRRLEKVKDAHIATPRFRAVPLGQIAADHDGIRNNRKKCLCAKR